MLWPCLKPAKESGVCLTSQVRPLSRAAIALIIFSAASSFVPTSRLDGDSFDLHLWLDGGEREGPEYIVPSLSEVFSAFSRYLCVTSFIYGVLCNNLYVYRLLLM
jgi:hypothetical protein